MANIVKTELKILLEKAESNLFYIRGLNLKEPTSSNEETIQKHMLQSIHHAPVLLRYLISCFNDIDQDISKIKEMRDILVRLENDFSYIDKHILIDGVNIDDVMNIDTQLVYITCKKLYQRLYRIPELQRVLDLLANFGYGGG